ncbi:MAG: hypothetical protein R3A52_09135 [Polyangiales bacterium]
MRVRPHRSSSVTEPAPIAPLFRSLLLAALAAEGCSDVVNATPDAVPRDAAAPDAAAPDATTPDATTPDAATPDATLNDIALPDTSAPMDASAPLLDACPAEQTNFTLDGQIDALRAAGGFDFLELRVFEATLWDGGLDPAGMWRTSATSGARCATATPANVCESAYAAIADSPGYGGGPDGRWVLKYTRGDEVGAIRVAEDLRRLYAPVDTIAAAVFAATAGTTLTVPCVGSARRLPSGAWEVYATRRSCRGGQMWFGRVNVTVTASGMTSANYFEEVMEGDCPVPGRRTEGLRAATPDAPDAVGRWLARAAHMEAASVLAFTTLAGELAALGAPEALVTAARRGADDERRHARVMGRLARRAGAVVPPVEVDAPVARSAFAVALENAVEGCVHETWAAMEALAQSVTATREGVAAAMGPIADDEMRHASLAWDVAAWLEPRLTDAEREAVNDARATARASLEARVARGHDAELTEALGLPGPALAARLAASLHAALA